MLEPNNLISEASDNGVSFLGTPSSTVSGSIDSVKDIDLYQFQLDQGQGITLDLDTVAKSNPTIAFDSYLRVFDSEGNELAFNDDDANASEEFSVDSFLGFIANQGGEYYVGVSSIANSSYDPVSGDNVNPVQDDVIAADYDLTLDLVEVIADEDRDNTISEAMALTSSSPASGKIDTINDVDIYQFTLATAEGINLNLKSADGLDSFLRVFDAQGQELAVSDNLSDPNNGNPAISFVADLPGEYYVGVGSAGNFNYDAVNGNTNLNFAPSPGTSTGSYELESEIVVVVPDDDNDNTLAEAIASGVGTAELTTATVDGAIDLELDVDLYQITVKDGEGIKLDLNSSDSGLDSFLRLFDGEGKELTFDDNDDFNSTGDLNKDSALLYAPTSPGEYYVGVSSSGNFDYDPVLGRNNFSPSVNNPFSTLGDYSLQIDLVTVVADIDPDNTLAEAVTQSATPILGEIEQTSDADIYQYQLAAGEGISLELEAITNSDLDAYLRLFDAAGVELAANDDNLQSDRTTDAGLNFIAETAGTYFVGVSSEGNNAYDAVNGRTNFTNNMGFSTGGYQLDVKVADVVGDQDPDNTIAEANKTGINSAAPSQTISKSIGLMSDSDIYEFELVQGETVTIDLDAAIINSNLDSVLRLFDAAGTELTTNDDGDAPAESSSTDSLIEYTATSDGKYYVGVSSFGNFDYDVLNGSNNFSNSLGSTTGNYDLVIDITGGSTNSAQTSPVNALNDNQTGDRLTGNGGADLFSLSTQSQQTIANFEDGIDKIVLADEITFDELNLINSSTGTAIAFNDQAIGLLLDVDAELITEADIADL